MTAEAKTNRVTVGWAKSYADCCVGFFSAAAVFVPLFGPVLGLPSALLSLVMLPAALVALFVAGWAAPARRLWVVWAPLILIATVAMLGSSPEQVAFLFSPPWRGRSELYWEAKLLMFVLTSLPAFVAAVVVTMAPDRERAITGALFAIAALALAAAIRAIAPNIETLIRTDAATAYEYFITEHGYSPVSYGILLAAGALGAMRFRHGWIVAGLLLFAVALLSRRADTLALVAVLAGLSAAYSVRARRFFVSPYPLAAILVGVALFASLHNGYNIQYFAGLGRAIDHRVEMIGSGLSHESGETIPTIPEQLPEPTSGPKWLFGHGLGSYQPATGSRFEYPHNLPFELYFELGLLAALAFAGMTMFPLITVAGQTVRGTVTVSALVCAACLTALIAISLKAGDISSLGRVAFVASLTLMAASSHRPST